VVLTLLNVLAMAYDLEGFSNGNHRVTAEETQGAGQAARGTSGQEVCLINDTVYQLAHNQQSTLFIHFIVHYHAQVCYRSQN
jgi:hypothetical protein